MSPSTAYCVGLLFEPVDGHDGEQLLDGPTIRHALEEREIAEVRVGQHGVQTFELFRKIIQVARHLLNAAADGPEQILRQAALFERQITQAEQIERLVERLLGVVIAFQHVLRSASGWSPANRSAAARDRRAVRRTSSSP